MKLTLLKVFTVLWLMGMYILLMATFITAYGSPQKAVRVEINSFQEANLEIVMLLVALLVSCIGAAFLISDISRDFLERNVKPVSETEG